MVVSGGKGGIGRMDEDDLGKVTRPRENDASDFTYLPLNHCVEDLPKQDLGHVHHKCETLSTTHIDVHHHGPF